MVKYNVEVEAVDEADALALKKRIKVFLKVTDGGDYKGRSVRIIQTREII